MAVYYKMQTGHDGGFFYSPYEIGPYSMVEINIFIPFTEL
jgi:hypothetical protein